MYNIEKDFSKNDQPTLITSREFFPLENNCLYKIEFLKFPSLFQATTIEIFNHRKIHISQFH